MSELERYARLLCELDAHDPDCLVYPSALAVGPRGLPLVPNNDAFKPTPVWELYRPYAFLMVSGITHTFDVNPDDFRDYLSAVLQNETSEEPTTPPEPPQPMTWRNRYNL